jgi:signal transduction histidine kinase
VIRATPTGGAAPAAAVRDVVQSGVTPRHRHRVAAPRDGARPLSGDEFASLVAHELRNPLNALSGWLHLLGADPALRADASRRALDGARRALDQQLATIDLLARVLRLRACDGPLERAPIDLGAVLDGAVAALGPAAAAAGCRIDVRRDGGPAAIPGDAALLRDAFVALGAYAIRHGTPGTPLRLALRTGPGAAVLSMQVDEGEPGRTSIWHAFGRSGARLPLELLHAALAVEAHGGSLGPDGEGRTGETFEIRFEPAGTVPAGLAADTEAPRP